MFIPTRLSRCRSECLNGAAEVNHYGGRFVCNWIIETKGCVWEDTLVKDAAISDWCRKVSVQTGIQWRSLRVIQTKFGDGQFASLRNLLTTIEGGRKLPI